MSYLTVFLIKFTQASREYNFTSIAYKERKCVRSESNEDY